jgi:hypothetical protein
MSVYAERLARNQVLFREVNERLREVLDASTGPTEFLCECSNEDCIETVPLEPVEYERIRANPNSFLVAPGHELIEIERVTWQSDRYFLVEKTVATDYVVRTDPRSRTES